MNCRRRLFLFALGCSLAGVTAGNGARGVGDPPDSQRNALTGEIEIVESILDGSPSEPAYAIRHSRDEGQGAATNSTLLGDAGVDDLEPRLAIDSQGKTSVVWWSDHAIPQIYLAQRAADGQWADTAKLSRADESSISPEIVVVRDEPWITYEIRGPLGRGIAVLGIGSESPEPFPDRTLIRWTERQEELDVRIHASPESLWTTWIDSDTDVGWSEYDFATETWSEASFEPYADDANQARKIIRERIDATTE